MRDTFDVLEAAERLDEILKRVEAGDEIAITTDGKTVARLVPIAAVPDASSAGSAEGAAAAQSSADEGGPVDAFENLEQDVGSK